MSFLPGEGSEPYPALLIDVAAGTGTELDISGLVRFLRAPLLRPAEPEAHQGASAPPPTVEPPTLSEDEARAAVDCPPPCTVTGTVAFDHPTWGPSVMVSLESDDEATRNVSLIVLDAAANEVWRWDNTTYYKLELHTPTLDEAGHLFIDYDPGRYNGVIILEAVPDGFESFGTLPPEGEYDARFYYAEVVDEEGDGTFEVDVSSNDCDPTCAGGTITHQIFRWDGDDYVGD